MRGEVERESRRVRSNASDVRYVSVSFLLSRIDKSVLFSPGQITRTHRPRNGSVVISRDRPNPSARPVSQHTRAREAGGTRRARCPRRVCVSWGALAAGLGLAVRGSVQTSALSGNRTSCRLRRRWSRRTSSRRSRARPVPSMGILRPRRRVASTKVRPLPSPTRPPPWSSSTPSTSWRMATRWV